MLRADEELRVLRFKNAGASSPNALRVGVVHPGDRVTPFGYALLSLLKQVRGIETSVYLGWNGNSKPAKRPPWLTDRLHSMSRRIYDPLGDSLASAGDSIATDFLDAIRAAHCDLIIWLAAYRASEVELPAFG